MSESLDVTDLKSNFLAINVLGYYYYIYQLSLRVNSTLKVKYLSTTSNFQPIDCQNQLSFCVQCVFMTAFGGMPLFRVLLHFH